MTGSGGGRHARNRHTAPTAQSAVMTAASIVALMVLVFIAYLLWPRWPDAPTTSGPDKLPISVGGVLLNVPQNALRVRVQRHSGAHERVDLAFLYPSLAPPGPPPRVNAENAADVPVAIDRIFLTIAAHGGAMSPQERMKAIYARYLEPAPALQPNGLRRQAFRDTSPYRDEDLFVAQNSDFSARCTRDAATPGICLSERRIGGADFTFRFPRSWLDQWQDVASACATLIAQLNAARRVN